MTTRQALRRPRDRSKALLREIGFAMDEEDRSVEAAARDHSLLSNATVPRGCIAEDDKPRTIEWTMSVRWSESAHL